MNLSDLPSFTPSTFPPSAFNYERPRHFIQSQPSFQAPSYESVVREAQENQNQNLSPQDSPAVLLDTQSVTKRTSQSQSRSMSQTQSQFQSLSISLDQNQTQSQSQNQVQTQVQVQVQANGRSKSSPTSSNLSSPSLAPPPTSSSGDPVVPPPNPTSSACSSSLSSLPRPTMRSSITLTPSVPSAVGLGSATLPANQDTLSPSAAYLCSVLPSAFSPFSSSSSSSKLSPGAGLPRPSISPSRSPLAPSSPLLPARATASNSYTPSQQPPPASTSSPLSPLSPSFSSSCTAPPSIPPAQPSSTVAQVKVPPAVVSLPISYKGTPNM